MPIEDGLKLVVSGGIVTPPSNVTPLPAKEPVSRTLGS
jgi:uncharacterized membrane protein